jgi:SAM-dependent methyltransferase
MKKYLFILKEIWKGRSVYRGYTNFGLSDLELRGSTIDIGGGRGGQRYVSSMPVRKDTVFESFDLRIGNQVDFEKDRLPAKDNAYDTVLFLNVLEHIFNYQHIANEVVRITKPDGRLIGVVPFFMWYHPDHRDFFRYTHEALEIIFKRAGVREMDMRPLYCGPFMVATHMIILLFPRVLRPIIFTLGYGLDCLFFFVKKTNKSKYILGYLFICQK